ncbi:MAG TPA: methionine adenosyltransferase domain-containing protein [Candidatus Paceibacterota bacterium]
MQIKVAQKTAQRTAEAVSPKHPDKLCDLIADSLLDAYLAGDPLSRVAAEVMGGHGHITVSGEVTSSAQVDVASVVHSVVGPDVAVHANIVRQSPEIGRGVDTGGAGDQGIMIGYATRETPSFLPREYVLARELCQKLYAVYPYDGKTQVTIDGDRVTCVVASFQNSPAAALEALMRKNIVADEYLVNPAGDWSLGGFDADSGISGRKIVIDNYGPEIGVGGGSFSGKDLTKVDRSGAYIARRIAVDYLKRFDAARAVRVKLAYAIGKSEPVMAVAEVEEGGASRSIRAVPIEGYDLSPRGIATLLKFDSVRWADTAVWGHFGREFSWG